MTDTFDMQVTLYGECITLDDAWAEFAVAYEAPDRSVGDAGGWTARLTEIRLGGSVKLSRDQAVELFGVLVIDNVEDAAGVEKGEAAYDGDGFVWEAAE